MRGTHRDIYAATRGEERALFLPTHNRNLGKATTGVGLTKSPVEKGRHLRILELCAGPSQSVAGCSPSHVGHTELRVGFPSPRFQHNFRLTGPDVGKYLRRYAIDSVTEAGHVARNHPMADVSRLPKHHRCRPSTRYGSFMSWGSFRLGK